MRKITRKTLTNQYRHKVKQTLLAVCRRYNIRHRAADEADFHRICKGERLHVFRTPPVGFAYGIHIYYRKVSFIYLHPVLTGDNFLWVAFHELGHHFMHRGEGFPLEFNRKTPKAIRLETEAELFAELILKRKVEVKLNAEK